MRTLILADSNIYIAALRSGKAAPFWLFDKHQDRYEFTTCEVVMLEVLRGIREPQVYDYVEREMERLIYLPVRKTTGLIARSLAWDLERAGRRVAVPDILIAACAKEAGAKVLTRDQHFLQMPGVEVIQSLL